MDPLRLKIDVLKAGEAREGCSFPETFQLFHRVVKVNQIRIFDADRRAFLHGAKTYRQEFYANRAPYPSTLRGSSVCHGSIALERCIRFRSFFDVVGYVRSQIIAAQSKFPYGHFVLTDIMQDHGLNVVDILNPFSIQLGFYHIQKITVQTFNQLEWIQNTMS